MAGPEPINPTDHLGARLAAIDRRINALERANPSQRLTMGDANDFGSPRVRMGLLPSTPLLGPERYGLQVLDASGEVSWEANGRGQGPIVPATFEPVTGSVPAVLTGRLSLVSATTGDAAEWRLDVARAPSLGLALIVGLLTNGDTARLTVTVGTPSTVYDTRTVDYAVSAAAHPIFAFDLAALGLLENVRCSVKLSHLTVTDSIVLRRPYGYFTNGTPGQSSLYDSPASYLPSV